MTNLNYQITTGKLTDDNENLIATGFSGNNSRQKVNPKHIQGMNNPAYVGLHCIGALPPGVYTLGAWGTHPEVGEDSASLTQIEGETYGRNDFYIHGPGTNDPQNSSEGCIVIPHDQRLKVMALAPSTITVSV
jgi:hypothetical protein